MILGILILQGVILSCRFIPFTYNSRTQDLTTQGVKRLCDYASSLENNLLEENIQTSASSSRLTFSSKAGALPAPLSEPSTPASIGSQEVQRPPRNAASPSSQQRSNGISGVAELTSGLGISKGIDTEEETTNRTSWLKPAFLMRTRSATNSVVQQILVDPPAP
ncbi:hypothetical protein POPTR_010G030400v4 [Populus trichocarpa]|uniref:Uncharacterized protein n=1 Tax=Populus trichocarpa TaxID=3694 RepID=A0A3N7FK70_POPTR|nr:hypothetical protein POPTR_010G030400v4 [Populus trichocarpa]RQO96188.1 hypothetical protein POPTR_010G030400v4 [Populus trichocarpa]RQO96190.1 hypothetical protein POPTR_010G030400v4 [Populus trichocarpa]